MNIYKSKIWKSITAHNEFTVSDEFLKFLARIKEEGLLNKNRIKILASFVEYTPSDNSNSLYNRYRKIIENVKDSTSEVSYILRYGEEEGKMRREQKLNKGKSDLAGFIERHGEEEGEKKYHLSIIRKSHGLESYILRHGEVDGKLKFEEYWKNTNFSTSRDAFHRRHGSEEGERLYKEFKSKMSEWSSGRKWKDKNQYTKMVEDRAKSVRKTSRFAYEYYKDVLGMTDEDAKQARSKYISDLVRPIYRASKQSLRVFIPIYKYIRKNYNIDRSDIKIGVKGSREYHIRYDKNKVYYYDFAIISKKIIIEFNGSRWHVRDINDKNDKCQYKTDRERTDKFYQDIHKLNIAKSQGFRTLTIWAEDNNNIEIVKDFIDELLKS